MHRLAGVYVYPHYVDEYGRTRLDMSITTRRFVIFFAHQLVSKVLLAPNLTKEGRTFTEDYSDVFAVPFDTIGRAKDAIFLQRHHMLQAGLGSSSATVLFFSPLLL